MKKAVFLDRDGTINEDQAGYIKTTSSFHLYPFAGKAIALLNKLGFYVFVVTNQSGVARGFYDFDDINQLHTKMATELAKDNAFVDDIFVSPYYKDGIVQPYNIAHDDRKPGLGMFEKAKARYEFDLEGSYMVGDRMTDIEFGKKAGLTSILLLTGEGTRTSLDTSNHWCFKPDYVVDDLLAAARLISQQNS